MTKLSLRMTRLPLKMTRPTLRINITTSAEDHIALIDGHALVVGLLAERGAHLVGDFGS